jgi:L-ribulose-5-phosphate 3-epimerase
LRIGFNGRFFPINWRPPADEVRFAVENGFDAIQVRVDPPATIADVLRGPAPPGVEWVVELLLRAATGIPAADAVRANLDAIHALGARRVHIHPVPGAPGARSDLAVELAEAVALAEREGLILGVEHNSREHTLLVEPEECVALLDAVPGLSFVWDLNHTQPGHLAAFSALKPRLSLVHVSDTPLPVTNHHLPLGLGNVDVSMLADIEVPAILEIGGLPASGGFGRDTDDALRTSRDVLRGLAPA